MSFGRLITAMITPFDRNGEVDHNKAQRLTEWLLNNGSDSVVVSGTTGESPTLTKKEKLNLLSAVCEAAKGHGKVLAGTSSYDTKSSVELTAACAKCGADGILAVAPYYNKPPQEGLYRHFEAIAAAADLPIMLYNIPGRTGINIAPQTIARLAAINNIFAVKEASGSIDQTGAILQLIDEDFLVYSGDDSMTLPILSLGGHGIVSVAGHIVGKEIKAMINMFFAGDVKGAAQMYNYLYPVFSKIFVLTNPIPIKYCINQLGFEVGECRLPLIPPDDNTRMILDQMLTEMGIAPFSLR